MAFLAATTSTQTCPRAFLIDSAAPLRSPADSFNTAARSSSREVRLRVPTFSVVYFGRSPPNQKRGEKGHYWGT